MRLRKSKYDAAGPGYNTPHISLEPENQRYTFNFVRYMVILMDHEKFRGQWEKIIASLSLYFLPLLFSEIK